MAHALTLNAPRRAPHGLRSDVRFALGVAVAVLALASVAATGIGATSASTTKTVTVTLASSLALSDPAALNPTPAPTAGVTWTPGATDVLNLGELQPTDLATASLTWRVTTNNPTGYSLTLQNAGTAPVLKNGSSGMADMPATPGALDQTHSHFGVSAGDAAAHTENAANFAGTIWGSTGPGGTQGTLYRDVPTGGMIVGSLATPATNEPTTLNFAATQAASEPLADGAYTGTVRFTAATI